jgi:hypothetical protein
MESVIRNVRDNDTCERQVLEHVLGRQLQENQQVIIQELTVSSKPTEAANEQSTIPPMTLPDWCNVYEGLREGEIADIEHVILQRADLTRPSE